MKSILEHTGECLCASVKIAAMPRSKSISACHCFMCQKWGGGPFLSVERGNNVDFEGAENIFIFDSSDRAQRGFCKNCGIHLFYRLKNEGYYEIPVGIFNQSDDWIFLEQLFCKNKSAFYSFANKTKCLTENEHSDQQPGV